MTDNIAYRNQSPYGWWIASYVEMAAWDDEPNPAPNSRCLAWGKMQSFCKHLIATRHTKKRFDSRQAVATVSSSLGEKNAKATLFLKVS